MDDLDPNVIRYKRYFIAAAQDCPIKQGRITIPPDLRETAELKKEVVLVGISKKFEIWDREKWEEEFQDDKKHFLKITREIHKDMGSSQRV